MRKYKLTAAGKMALGVMLVSVVGVTAVIAHLKNGTTEPVQTAAPVSTKTPDATVVPEPTPTPVPTIDPAVFYDTDSLLIVANKSHPLPEGYVPDNLVSPQVSMTYSILLKEPAAQALEQMFAAMNEDGLNPVLTSGYRSAEYQSELYNGYCAQYGSEVADTISSRPGHSDHQTGLAADITCAAMDYSLTQDFENTAEGKWLKEHAHEYGFIMRYPYGKEEITGYSYEPWHFRYIGTEEATKVYTAAENESFEEYYGVTGGDYTD